MPRMDISSISCEMARRQMPQDLAGGYLTLVQVLVWCRQATSHHMSQFWTRSMSPYDATKPQCDDYIDVDIFDGD